MNTFTINKKRYNAKPFSFNCVCELEDLGVSLQDIQKKSMSFLRAYFAYCADLEKDEAGAEIQAHVIGKGTFEELQVAVQKEVAESDFFLALNETAEEEASTETTTKKK